MDWTLEVVPVPVADVDRAKRFYGEQVGFNVDHDTKVADDMRVVPVRTLQDVLQQTIGTRRRAPDDLRAEPVAEEIES